MKRYHLIIFLFLMILEGVVAILILQGMVFDPGRGNIINYSDLRWILISSSSILVLFFVVVQYFIIRPRNFAPWICQALDKWLTGSKVRLFFVQGALLILAVFFFEAFLLTYLAFPVPMRPIFVWASVTFFQIWFILRLAYSATYRKRVSWIARLRRNWSEWMPIQRKTFIILSLMALVYFIGFMPSNYLPNEDGNFYTHSDEAVIYPDVARVLVIEGSFYDMVKVILEDWPWWYGYPYLTLSAGVLVIPRLLFGNGFAENIQLNVFLLRQFINILPMLLALMLLVYMVNRYKSLWLSVALFGFLVLVPGVIKFNHQFWHPDSLIILLILLTFYFLEKDNLSFKRYFYYAAVTCGLATAIKLWGVFFVLAIAGYLLAGLWKRKIPFKLALLSGFGFLFAMAGTIVITSPSLLAPYIRNTALEGWSTQQNALLHGYNEPDPTGVYETGLANAVRFFGFYYMKPFFLGFASISVVLGSFFGSRKTLNRLILAWSLAAGFFLVNFAAMKNFVYLMPLMMPLFLGAALFPSLMDGLSLNGKMAFLNHPVTTKIGIGITLIFFLVQFVINTIIVFISQ